MSTIIGRMRQYLLDSKNKEYIGINYLDDAINAIKEIKKINNVEFVDSDFYSPLLYELWGEILLKKKVLKSYLIEVKDYRYIMRGVWGNSQEIILGTDALLSNKKNLVNGYRYIREFRYAGGFAIWPSHRGGINFRKNRYNDNIFLTLDDIEKYYQNPSNYEGVIPKVDFNWFKYIGDNFNDVFFFEDYKIYRNDLLAFENVRSKRIIEFISND